MTCRSLSFAALALVLFGPEQAPAEELAPKAEQLVTEAKKVQLEAQDISKELKPRGFDLARVQEMMANLERHVTSVDQLVKDLAPHEPQMTSHQKAKYEAVKMKAQLLTVFITNKRNILAGDELSKNRSLLRSKADGIARRAELLQQSAMALRR
ncbi:MAG: hypothetical protein H7039_07900 [Bryobacteraceae bacterium]|nr:hypothetical protein [Bryobacteraceae bacterium]